VYPREVLVLCTLYNQPMRPNAIHLIFHQLYSPSLWNVLAPDEIQLVHLLGYVVTQQHGAASDLLLEP
jgi:hypothetical protein